jgi:multimeric flavodoxin WrbA
MNQTDILIIACSPRKGGNSDFAAGEVAGAAAGLGLEPELLYLRDFHVTPCLGCGKCATSPDFECVLDGKDQCRYLLDKIQYSGLVCFCSPIFFYHLPAHFKGLIDRGQSLYERWLKTGAHGKKSRALCVLVAGRKIGQSLFTGSLLTLKYFFEPLNRELSHLCLRGIDGKGDLALDRDARSKIHDYVTDEVRGQSRAFE